MDFKLNSNICRCNPPKKKYSDAGCYLCWTCEICGNFGGCDNRYWEINNTVIDEHLVVWSKPDFISYKHLPMD